MINKPFRIVYIEGPMQEAEMTPAIEIASISPCQSSLMPTSSHPMEDLPVPEHFNYCPRCGSEGMGRVDDKDISVKCDSCDFRMYFNPISSAGALIEDHEGRLLVIERAKAPAKGKYGVPGGFTDKGECLEEVIVREVKEEVNLDIRHITFLASFPNEYHYRSVIYSVTDAYFLAYVDSFEALAPETAEVAGIQFVNPSEIPDEQWAFSSLRKAVRYYLQQQA